MIARTLAYLLIMNFNISTANAMITENEWRDYVSRFVSGDGRIVDDGNGGITHSEGQGYGLLLAYLAGNRPDFERIWSFTQRELMLRDDSLSAWKWDPDATPKVTDVNNASDGDILIAYSLAIAGEAWMEERFLLSAAVIASALASKAVFEHKDELLLSPGVSGFDADDRSDGPVINLSYWIFEAFPVLEKLAPELDWSRLSASGMKLVAQVAFGKRQLPADWISIAEKPEPAEGFPIEFGYNSLRIPLYLMRGGEVDTLLLRRLRDGMTGGGGAVVLINLSTDEVTAELNDPGYRIIPAFATCILDGVRIPKDLLRFQPTLYYPSTLQLLALSHIREERPECL